MNKITIKLTNGNVILGNAYTDYDCLSIELSGKPLQIGFDKKDNIAQYIGSEVIVVEDGGLYSIKRVHETAKTSDKK